MTLVLSESHVTWATSVPVLVFTDLTVVDLGLMYVTDIQIDVRQHRCLIPCLGGVFIIMLSRQPKKAKVGAVVCNWSSLFNASQK